MFQFGERCEDFFQKAIRYLTRATELKIDWPIEIVDAPVYENVENWYLDQMDMGIMRFDIRFQEIAFNDGEDVRSIILTILMYEGANDAIKFKIWNMDRKWEGSEFAIIKPEPVSIQDLTKKVQESFDSVI
jgi:hypothetical protein